MGCIVLRSKFGTERKIPENTPYILDPGESIVGVDRLCAGKVEYNAETELSNQGVQWGDAIAAMTKILGVRQCSSCRARQEILNRAREQGWAETARQLKETFK